MQLVGSQSQDKLDDATKGISCARTKLSSPTSADRKRGYARAWTALEILEESPFYDPTRRYLRSSDNISLSVPTSSELGLRPIWDAFRSS
ncbi:hypothetical protein LMH87_010246 [Akanthomyces muscarius]|uniref:Uncharacterized protein n=1 Tax=Akanthomyces muscarius TaxID=2231603 RepID=A0A9W8QF52_AKAMU|nr:hypothetical protein LMH87_010246 [Akanthomyces muscarius]KAJ4153773.1 hypothetical protein LMH87_010246 [Akanthomyces muscarius]